MVTAITERCGIRGEDSLIARLDHAPSTACTCCRDRLCSDWYLASDCFNCRTASWERWLTAVGNQELDQSVSLDYSASTLRKLLPFFSVPNATTIASIKMFTVSNPAKAH